MAIFARTVAGAVEDEIMCSLHFAPAVGTQLNPTQRGSVVSAFDTFWNAYKALVPTSIIYSKAKFYEQMIWPIRSPLLQTFDVTDNPGAGAGIALPAQISWSITLETLQRRRWGRFYMPGADSVNYRSDKSGRITTATVDAMGTAAATFVQACKTGGALPVVWSPRGGAGPPAWAPGEYLPVTAVRADDIADIVRRRRAQDKPYRKTVVIT